MQWVLINIVGPLVLVLVLAWAVWRNKRDKTPGQEELAERSARDLRERLNEEDVRREGKP